ncbi:hypothetical protein COB55_02920, partial [Candidatus Wolfebacteria bacterium]
NWLNSPTDDSTGSIEAYIKSSSHSIKEYLLAAMYIALVFAIRLSILILSLPLFFLVAILAIVDGLAIRDVRRWSNGRESGFRYHYAKSFVLPSFFVAWVMDIEKRTILLSPASPCLLCMIRSATSARGKITKFYKKPRGCIQLPGFL